MLSRRRMIATAAVSLAGTSLPHVAWPQPVSKTAHWLVGFPPGGSSDLSARLLVDRMKGYAPTMVVDNRPGAGGRLALELAKAGPADGSLIVLTPMSMMVIYPHTHKTLGYKPLTDFVAVTTVTEFPFVIGVGPLVPPEVKTLADFVAWCRANPNLALYSTSGAGSTLHLTGVMLSRAANFEFGHVPYNGAGPAQQDVLGGRVAANIGVLGSALPQIQAGRLRALATSGAQRSGFLPDVPSFREAGFADVVATEWQGVFVPAKTPRAIVDNLNAAIHAALKIEEVKAGLNKLAFEVTTNTPEEFADLMKTDTVRWADIVKAAGLTPED